MSVNTRPEGKLATTYITNELARELNNGPRSELGYVSLPFGVTNALMGQILPAGPGEIEDFKDNRYWVRCVATKAQPLYAGPDDHPQVQAAVHELTDIDHAEELMVVTNLAEQWGYPHVLKRDGTGDEPVSYAGPHTLPAGLFIQFGVTTDYGEATVKFRYVTFTIPKMVSLIEVTAYADGGGMYYGFECQAPNLNDILPNVGATLPIVAGPRSPFSCLVVNFNELGASGHALDLATSKLFTGYLLRINEDGTPVYGASMTQGESLGQYQGMVKQMVTDLGLGFDRVRGHGLL